MLRRGLMTYPSSGKKNCLRYVSWPTSKRTSLPGPSCPSKAENRIDWAAIPSSDSLTTSLISRTACRRLKENRLMKALIWLRGIALETGTPQISLVTIYNTEGGFANPIVSSHFVKISAISNSLWCTQTVAKSVNRGSVDRPPEFLLRVSSYQIHAYKCHFRTNAHLGGIAFRKVHPSHAFYFSSPLHSALSVRARPFEILHFREPRPTGRCFCHYSHHLWNEFYLTHVTGDGTGKIDCCYYSSTEQTLSIRQSDDAWGTKLRVSTWIEAYMFCLRSANSASCKNRRLGWGGHAIF